MTKHCDVCNQDYADELPACPHCAAANKLQPDIILGGQASKPTSSDSAIDLGQDPRSRSGTGEAGGGATGDVVGAATGDAAGVEPAPISDISAVEWAALVEEPADEAVKIDSPSDTDLLAHSAAELTDAPTGGHPVAPPPAEGGGEGAPAASAEEIVGDLFAEEVPAAAHPSSGEGEAIDLAGAPPKPAASDSAVDLGASPVEVVEEVPPGESDVFVAELASDPHPVELVGDADVPVAEESPSSRDLIAEAVESGIDAGRPEAEVTEEAALDAVMVDEPSSAVDLGAPASGQGPISAVPADEVVQVPGGSGIDLEGLPVPVATFSDSGSDDPHASESKVDLGSREEVSMSSRSSDSGIDLESGTMPAAITGSDSELDINLDAAAARLAAEQPPGGEAAADEAEVDQLLAEMDQAPPVESEPAAAETVAEAELPAVEEEEKPARAAKPPSRVPALVGGLALGILLGAGGTMGARALMGPGEPEKKSSGPAVVQQQPQAKAPTFQERRGHLLNGDFDKAAEAGIQEIEENNPEELAARGSYRLGAYLQKTGAKVNPEDPTLKSAMEDLQKAASDQQHPSSDAIYDLGLIYELANKLPEAVKQYNAGLKQFEKDPIQKRRFQSALDRVETRQEAQAAGAAFLPMPGGVEDRVAVLALLLIGLQQPTQPQPGTPPSSGEEEAGFEFWDAAKLARRGNYKQAIEAIDKARKLHDQRRFTRLRKAQNPLSDPTEDIFLRCCDELRAYWQLEAQLRSDGYLTEKNTPVQAVTSLVQAAKGANAGTGALKGVTDQLIKEKVITKPEELNQGITRLVSERNMARKEAADLMTKLQKATDDSAAKLKTAEGTIKDRDTKLLAAADREKKLKTDNDALGGTLKKITDDLAAAKLLDPTGKPDVSGAVRKAIDLAKSADPQGQVRKLQGEVEQAQAALKLRRSPEQMMSIWQLLLEQNHGRPELASQAMQDADRVKANSSATALQKGQAEVVRGLALRNVGQFAEAKAALESARTMVDKGAWLAVADLALHQVSDPAAYAASQAEILYERGEMDAALALLDGAMKGLPAKDQGKLLAQRSLMELDAARSKFRGRIPPADPLVVAARKDAEEAAKVGLADGHYAAGRIAEELGQWDAAIQSYRKALAAHSALDAEGSHYRIALARVLALPRETRPALPTPQTPGKKNKVGRRDPVQNKEALKRFALLAALTLQAPGLPDGQPGIDEAEKLADEVLKASPDRVPFNLRAQALAIKGLWTPALQTYAEGIRPLLPREYADGLLFLVANHPRLRRPDSLRTPNPFDAEKHFAAGLNAYFDGDYASSEKELLLAIQNDNQDARYFYFLGLSRLAQNRRRDAALDFDEGAQLERLNRPAPAAVSESLERIQGTPRRILNEVRNRPEG